MERRDNWIQLDRAARFHPIKSGLSSQGWETDGEPAAKAAEESKVATKIREERRSQRSVNEGARRRVCQPSPRLLSTAVASTERLENVYCCSSWGPISIAVLHSPPSFRLLDSVEGMRYSSRTMETSAIARLDVVMQPDYSSLSSSFLPSLHSCPFPLLWR